MRFRTLTRIVFVVLATAAVALPVVAQKHAPHDPKRMMRDQIEALEQQWRLSQLTNDVPAMEKLLSDDYLGVTGTGEVLTKSQQLDRMRARTRNLSQLTLSDIKIKLIGQVAIVNSLAQVEGTSDGASINGSFRYTRIYQRVGSGTWKTTSFEITRIPTGGRRRTADSDAAAAPRP